MGNKFDCRMPIYIYYFHWENTKSNVGTYEV